MTEAIDAMLDYHRTAGHYPGALIQIRVPSRPAVRRVFGTLRGEAGADGTMPAMREDARFRIASLTKPMVSVVALMLVAEGRLALDMPVAGVVPELAGRRLADGSTAPVQPTIAHLLTHTSGLQYAAEIRDAAVREHALALGLGNLPGMTRHAFVEALADLPLSFAPGSRFCYGYSTDVLGLVIERIAGQTLDTVLRERLLEPLGMHDTTFRMAPEHHAQMPAAFVGDKAWFAVHGQFEAAEKRVAAGDPADGPGGLVLSGGGGLVSTLDDVARFAAWLADGGRLGGRPLLAPAMFEAMVANQLGPQAPGPDSFVGGGWGFGHGLAVRLETGAAAYPCQPGEVAWSGVTGQSLFVRPGTGWYAVMLSANTASRIIVRFEFRRAAERVS